MTDHTPERWVQHEMGHQIFIGPGSADPVNLREVVIVFDIGGLTKAAEQRERDHAARIVACVNACAGIPTEQLQPGFALLDKQAQADVERLINAASNLLFHQPVDVENDDLWSARVELRAALAPFLRKD